MRLAERPLRSLEDVESFEAVPLEERIRGLRRTYDVIARGAVRYGDAPAFAFVPEGDHDLPEKNISYRELFVRVTRAANLFHARGIGPGDVVAYMLPNRIETHVTLWAAETAGVACAIGMTLEAEQIASILVAAGAKVLVTVGPSWGNNVWQKVLAARALAKHVETLVLVGEHEDLAPDVLSFDRALASQRAGSLCSAREIDGDDVAYIFDAGGTASAPRLAQHTHRSEIVDALCTAWAVGMRSSDSIVCGLPFFHLNGVIVTGLAPMLAGARLVLLGAASLASARPLGGRSAGVPLPYQQRRTAQLDANESFVRDCCLVDEIGTIAIRGPNVFPDDVHGHPSVQWVLR